MKKKNRGHKGDAQKVNLTTKQLRSGVPKEVEIITPEAKPVLAQRQIPPYVRGTTIAVSAGFLFWVVAWCLQSFLSIRGVVDINASRVILIVMWFSGALLICLLARVLPFIRRKQLVAILCNVLWIMSVVALDRWAARPQVTNIPTPAPYVRPADWRTIKDWQKAELVPLLERYPNYTLHIMASAVSDESLDYANQFKELFAAHKWKVIGPETVADQIALNMQLSISDQYWGKPGPEAFTALNSALQFIHIKTTPNFVVDPVARPDELVMWIGPQTPPGYPQHIPLQLGTVCRNPLQFTDDTMHFIGIGGDAKDFVRWVRIKPPSKDLKFVAGQRLFVFLTGQARSVANSEYFKVQALGTPMPRPDALDINLTRDLKVGEQVDLKIISDTELRVKCVDNRL